MKKTIIAGTLILGTTLTLTGATLAQGYYGGRFDNGYGYRGGYGYNYGPSDSDVNRGGPGPRVQGGSGTGIGAER